MRKSLRSFAWLTLAFGAAAHAQQSTTHETTPEGVTFKVTQQVVQRSIPTTEYQTHQQKVYRPQITTQYQSYQQTQLVPVTQYQWVARLNGRWNPFIQPYWTHELAPVTRWEARAVTMQVPTSRTDWVEEVRTVQVPVTTYRQAQETIVHREPVSALPFATSPTSIASLPVGSQQYQSDPPAEPSPWAGRPNTDSVRR
jgi:hypothetical protein